MGLALRYNLVEELQVNVRVVERSALDVERLIWLKVKEAEWLACGPHQTISSRLGITKEGRCVLC